MPSKAEPVTHPSDLGVYGLPGDVSPWDIRFDPEDRAFLQRRPNGGYHFTAITEPGLIDGAVVVGAASAPAHVYPMQQTGSTVRHTTWETQLSLQPGNRYSFAFRTPWGQGVYRVPSGISSAVERLDRWELTDIQPVQLPDWAQGAVIYQIFPDRFANADPSLNPHDVVPWGSPPHPTEFQGGDLAGISKRLDYLSALGVDAIYLNPVFTSPSTHRYDTIDYYQVDPMLGGNTALEELVTAAHSLSIRVILDASFNHVHPRFFAFNDVVQNGSESSFWNWFNITDPPPRIVHRPSSTHPPGWIDIWNNTWREEMGLPVHVVEGDGPAVETNYEAWYGVPTMPRVDLSNPEARQYFTDVATHWIREYDIDGWRMDVARYVDPDFWNHLRKAVKAAKPDSYLLAEIMGDASQWLQGDRFDATMNYTFRDITTSFFATENTDGHEFLDQASRLVAQYPRQTTLINHNLLSSHDTPRFLTCASGELWRLELATVFQLTFPGAPGIFYGDEIGLEGGHDPGCRRAFPARVETTRHSVHQIITQLTSLRRAEPALIRGTWQPIDASKNHISYKRSLDDRHLLVIINRGNSEIHIQPPQAISEILWGTAPSTGDSITIQARTSTILTTEP